MPALLLLPILLPKLTLCATGTLMDFSGIENVLAIAVTPLKALVAPFLSISRFFLLAMAAPTAMAPAVMATPVTPLIIFLLKLSPF